MSWLGNVFKSIGSGVKSAVKAVGNVAKKAAAPVLGAVGTLVGGPLGATVGAAVGKLISTGTKKKASKNDKEIEEATDSMQYPLQYQYSGGNYGDNFNPYSGTPILYDTYSADINDRPDPNATAVGIATQRALSSVNTTPANKIDWQTLGLGVLGVAKDSIPAVGNVFNKIDSAAAHSSFLPQTADAIEAQAGSKLKKALPWVIGGIVGIIGLTVLLTRKR